MAFTPTHQLKERLWQTAPSTKPGAKRTHKKSKPAPQVQVEWTKENTPFQKSRLYLATIVPKGFALVTHANGIQTFMSPDRVDELYEEIGLKT